MAIIKFKKSTSPLELDHALYLVSQTDIVTINKLTASLVFDQTSCDKDVIRNLSRGEGKPYTMVVPCTIKIILSKPFKVNSEIIKNPIISETICY